LRESFLVLGAGEGAVAQRLPHHQPIAGKLFPAEGTVRNYLSAAIAQAGARNRAEAVRTAGQRGWL